MLELVREKSCGIAETLQAESNIKKAILESQILQARNDYAHAMVIGQKTEQLEEFTDWLRTQKEYNEDENKIVVINDLWLPPLPSVLKTTEVCDELITRVAEYFTPFSEAIFTCGSMVYGRYFSLRPDSDLDVFVIVRGEEDLMNSAQVVQELGLVQANEVAGQAIKDNLDDVSFKFRAQSGKHDLSIHFINQRSFERVCQLDWENETRIFCQGKFGRKPDSKLNQNHFDFEAKRYVYENFESAHPYYGTICNYPYPIIEQGKFVSSHPIDRVLFSRYLGGNEEYFEGYKQNLIRQIVLRYEQEKANNLIISSELDLSVIAARKKFFPNWYKKSLQKAD